MTVILASMPWAPILIGAAVVGVLTALAAVAAAADVILYRRRYEPSAGGLEELAVRIRGLDGAVGALNSCGRFPRR